MTKQTISMRFDPAVKVISPVICSQGRHVCKHRGSKPDTQSSKARNRAANKLAKRSRRINRKAN